jgi:hypothetical protein
LLPSNVVKESKLPTPPLKKKRKIEVGERENGWVSPKVLFSSLLNPHERKGEREREREKPSRHTKNGIRFLSPLPHSYCDKFLVGNFPLSLHKPVMGLHSSLLTHVY